jgi:hypothetical protein
MHGDGTGQGGKGTPEHGGDSREEQERTLRALFGDEEFDKVVAWSKDPAWQAAFARIDEENHPPRGRWVDTDEPEKP